MTGIDTTTTAPADGARRRLHSPTAQRYVSAFRTPKGMLGATILGTMCAAALLAPILFPGGFDLQGRDALTGVSLAHPFGQDEFGRDIFTRSIYGLRMDLSLILLAVPISMGLGMVLGLTGVVSERLGAAVQRLFDVIIGFPSLVLGICLVAVMGPGWLPLFLTIAISGMPTAGRLARGAWLAQQSREYVVAARVLGVPRRKVLTRHVLPHALDAIIVNSAIWMVAGVYIEAGLSIVGLGVQPPTPSLGVLLNNGLRFVTQSPTYVLGPALILFLLALAFNLIADALNRTVSQ